jgi:2-polyprenyl-3-methyl-5-hydroxy-6-metoxy-1,4-benzoquinol methylase
MLVITTMRPEERENQRYATEDFCPISMEEEKMFELLGRYVQERRISPPQLKILDIGCGSGKISKELMKRGYRVVGLDFSEEAVKKANQQGVAAKRVNLDDGIPEASDTYDAVWAGDIIEHVFDPIGLLKESARVLKPGGAIFITIPSDVGLVSRIKILFGISHQEQMYTTSGFYKHHTFFTPRLIRFMLKKVNLDIYSFKKILILGKKRYEVQFLPSAFFNEMIIAARKQ